MASPSPSSSPPTRDLDLPNEIIYMIADLLFANSAYGTAIAFARVNHRLSDGLLGYLYEHVALKQPDIGGSALIWAAEFGELDVMERLLDYGVDPNYQFWSYLPEYSRRDLFEKQGPRQRRTLLPRFDGHFVANVIQEELCSHLLDNTPTGRGSMWYDSTDPSTVQNFYTQWLQVCLNGNILTCGPPAFSISNDDEDSDDGQDILPDWVERLVNLAAIPRRESLQTGGYYWGALHVACKRGDTAAVNLLLDRGADREMFCRGYCDCLDPKPKAVHSNVNLCTAKRPMLWKPLHIAICSIQEDIVRLLLDRGSHDIDVGHSECDGKPDDYSLSAFDTAACTGNIAMCQLLHDRIATLSVSRSRTLGHAILSGNIRTTGKWLLDQGFELSAADPHSPLVFLCFYGLYRDANYLLDLLAPGTPSEDGPHLRALTSYTVALRACFVCQTRNDSRHVSHKMQDKAFMESMLQETRILYPKRGKEEEQELLTLIKRLLQLGADPDLVVAENACSWCGILGDSSWFSCKTTTGSDSALGAAIRKGYRALDGYQGGEGFRMPPLNAFEDSTLDIMETVIYLLERPDGARPAKPLLLSFERSLRLFQSILRGRVYELWKQHKKKVELYLDRLLMLLANDGGLKAIPLTWAKRVFEYGVLRSSFEFCEWWFNKFQSIHGKGEWVQCWTSLLFTNMAGREPRASEVSVTDLSPQLPSRAERMLAMAGPSALSSVAQIATTYADLRSINFLLDSTWPGDQFISWLHKTILALCKEHSTKEGVPETVDKLAEATLREGLHLDPRELPEEPYAYTVLERSRADRFYHMSRTEILKARETLEALLRVISKYPHLNKTISSNFRRFVYRHPPIYRYGVICGHIDSEILDMVDMFFAQIADGAPLSSFMTPTNGRMKCLYRALEPREGLSPPNPEILEVVLKHNKAIDLNSPIWSWNNIYDGKPETCRGGLVDGKYYRVMPILHTLLEGFARACRIPPVYSSDAERVPYNCQCALVLREKMVVESINVLIRHGARWDAENEGQTPLDKLRLLLEAEVAEGGSGHWVKHNHIYLKKYFAENPVVVASEEK
ncbi:hypothetical protein B0T21DRAFT_345098 [Apiosordaria backusii]|uniref:Uncharacterized protein n=1 Tax=Apiosordaria backusii TaxID=314023 RepID=A0AA40ETA0_9PEZI|nr:hypothetical protein B0T21DRAFT_345098 [Apiosordaria backusii]